MGYVVCPAAVTPVELASRTPEAPIPLPVSGTPTLGNTAITVAPGGRWAYVVLGAPQAGGGVRNEVVPVDLVAQRAGRPIALPGRGPARAVTMTADGRTVLAASGTTVVPVDPATRAVGTPLDLGAGRTVAGLARAASGPVVYALVPGGVVPIDTAAARAAAPVATGLQVSSLTSPHGLAPAPDGATLYVAGQGGADFGGRLVPVATATGAVGPAASFDRFGIAAPAAAAVTPDGTEVLVVDSADSWITAVPAAAAGLGAPTDPVRLPAARPGGPATGHPSDIVIGPDGTGAFLVTGYDAVLPYDPARRTFGRPMAVCPGATSMAVAPARTP
jgi:DNA-binding beta-propeller fold protein YncE